MFKKSENAGHRIFNLTHFQSISLVVLRVAIGWHFLYEGIVKIMNPNWSSAGYLLDSKAWFTGMFQGIAMNSHALKIVDLLNMWGLTAIGLGLILGLFTRVAIVGGMILLIFYYVSHPSLIGLEYALPNEGNYMIINKTLIELLALWVLFQFSGVNNIGLDRIIIKNKLKTRKTD